MTPTDDKDADKKYVEYLEFLIAEAIAMMAIAIRNGDWKVRHSGDPNYWLTRAQGAIEPNAKDN